MNGTDRGIKCSSHVICGAFYFAFEIHNYLWGLDTFCWSSALEHSNNSSMENANDQFHQTETSCTLRRLHPPDNILISFSDPVMRKVSDFKLSKSVDSRGSFSVSGIRSIGQPNEVRSKFAPVFVFRFFELWRIGPSTRNNCTARLLFFCISLVFFITCVSLWYFTFFPFSLLHFSL